MTSLEKVVSEYLSQIAAGSDTNVEATIMHAFVDIRRRMPNGTFPKSIEKNFQRACERFLPAMTDAT